ncbi:MAG: hypothetical protein A2161_00695 [Candidatus Schekmanbacteria bacterium RBG_13_48_7]|uniref:Methyltransferase type 11 domain-containing protein n=1 Tax=Candidatus Schekmanbacteria bacterium RBG_13_48_7 TaxID=1817878 RepID=A0A1F7RWC9_9BACT|nr:MAG: hypothetical protein A2161_00695 [Candidatus Schekmanbacteria bacterium RBG_13_48_7]
MSKELNPEQQIHQEILEIEPYGVEYERYALQKLFGSLAEKYQIKTVAEIPAVGAKAMPSIYSIGWALAGCKVTLINGDTEMKKYWDYLNLSNQVTFLNVENVLKTNLPENQFDLVWNFNVLPGEPKKDQMMNELKRLTRHFLLFIHVNGYNIGFPFHRFAHLLTKIPWIHGDVRYNKPSKFKRILEEKKLKIVETGVVDCPYWPDSLGFRDIRLHKQSTMEKTVCWKSHYIEWVKSGKFPGWLKRVYILEKLPVPFWMKYPYAHLFYVIIQT